MLKTKKFCVNCGAEIDVEAEICPGCGVRQQKMVESVSSAWYLVPLFLGIIGGLIAWVVNKDRDPGKARNFIILGVALTVIGVVLWWGFIAALFSYPYY